MYTFKYHEVKHCQSCDLVVFAQKKRRTMDVANVVRVLGDDSGCTWLVIILEDKDKDLVYCETTCTLPKCA